MFCILECTIFAAITIIKAMQKSLLIPLLAMLIGCSSQQEPGTNDYSNVFGLKGPVAEVRETHFQEPPYIDVYQFDKQGRLTHYHSLGNPAIGMDEDMDFWETTESRDYWYDENGQIQGDEEDIAAFPQPYEEYGDTMHYTVRRNDHGDIIEFQSKRYPDDINAEIHIFYDTLGNWVGKAEFWLGEYDVDIRNIVAREIKYYE